MKNVLLVVVLGVCLLAAPAWATTFNGTLSAPSSSGGSSTLSWNGGPLTGTNGVGGVFTTCTTLTCDFYNLTVNVPATFYASNPSFAVHITANWDSTLNDIDLYILDTAGNVVCSSTQGSTNWEDADCGQLATGTYTVQIASSTTANATYSGKISLATEPTIGARARYKPGNFTFTQPLVLSRPPSAESTLFLEQDAEPRVGHDALGNIYAAAIQGVPAGSDFWKSMDGGKTFTYLGQPDGAQAAAAVGTNGVGVGGGDEDFVVGPNGKLALSSLWLGSVTNCATSNGATSWICNPFASNVPEDDRQWVAWDGNSTVYLTTKNLGALLVGTQTVYVVKSTDGGVTFGAPVALTLPELGIQPGDQGNLITDRNGYVYNVFFDHTASQLYLAKSTDGGQSFALKLVYQAPSGQNISHVFPAIAADNGGGLHVVFSDGTNSYLTSSPDGGVNWSAPIRLNNSWDSKTAIEPWVVAGDYGKVNVFFYGTPSSDFMDLTAQWKIFMAQSLNVFGNLPLVTQSAATYVMHKGAICVNGTGCASGTRNLLEYFYPDVYLDGNAMAVFPDDLHVDSGILTRAWFIKQTGGSKVTGSK